MDIRDLPNPEQLRQERLAKQHEMRICAYESGKNDAFWNMLPRFLCDRDYMSGYRSIHPRGLPFPPR